MRKTGTFLILSLFLMMVSAIIRLVLIKYGVEENHAFHALGFFSGYTWCFLFRKVLRW